LKIEVHTTLFTMPAPPNKTTSHSNSHRREQPFFTFEAEWEPTPHRNDYQTCIHRLRVTLRETTLCVREGGEIYEQLAMIFLIVKDLEEILHWVERSGNEVNVRDELRGIRAAAQKLKSDTTGKALGALTDEVEKVGKRCLEGWFY
jgi:ATP-dependent RNA circularization protein (DNA/RNA ligase family)